MQAHRNNFRNDPQGRYHPDTGRLTKYKDGKVKAEPARGLSHKIAESRKASALRHYEAPPASRALARSREHAAAREASPAASRMEASSAWPPGQRRITWLP